MVRLADAYDVVVAGGGPAGLAAAIVAAERGASVLVLEQRAHPPDKACGEGLLPPAVRALDRLGVLADVPAADRHPFTGIRFVQEDGAVATLPLPGAGGLGIRRTALVAAMARRAAHFGVTIADRTAVRVVHRGRDGAVVTTSRGIVRAVLVVGADGLHSPLRRSAGLTLPSRERTRGRFAVRRHFAIRPWSTCVEVHVSRFGEAVVTPVAADMINVNVVWDPDAFEAPTFETLCEHFPALQTRLAHAPSCSTPRGAGPMAQLALRRTADRLALIGDAGGFLDSIAADGMAMAFNAALALGATLPAALANGASRASLAPYERAARRLFRNYRVVTSGLLWIARHPRLRWHLIHYLARHQAVGDAMMSGAMRLMLASTPS